MAVDAGQSVPVYQIGQLRYEEPTDALAESDNFTFQVQDDGGAGGGTLDLDPVPRTMTVELNLQHRTLTDFYQSAGGDEWSNNQGWLGEPGTECGWFGVTCIDGQVRALQLQGNNLSGTIPATLSRLHHLQSLMLHNNSLGGAIPSTLGELPALVTLHLYENQLSGAIPPELGSISTLEILRLHANQLTGEIPPELGNLNNLTSLILSFNPLSGEVPASLGNLPSLKTLYLSDNQLSGTIPSALGNLSSLLELSLLGNDLTGSIPTELANLSELKYLYLHENQLTGPVPAELAQLTKLEDMILHDNQLSGAIPAVLGDLISLKRLALSFNQLTGRIPESLGNLTNLEMLALRDNQLVGAVPASLGNLTALQSLYLSDNRLSWKYPQSIIDLQIPDLEISGNFFDSERNALIDLYNSTNGEAWINHTGWLGAPGTECDWYGVVCEDGLLTGVNLPGNGLVGTLPEALGATPHLATINVSNNYISAPLPEVFSGIELNLDYNPIDTVNPVQIVSTTHDSGMLFITSTNRLSFHYDVSDDTAQLTGLGMRVHFNSAHIDSMVIANPLEASLLAFDTSAKADVDDFDNNPTTDRYISIAWGAVSGDWPGTLPIKLFDLDVSANASLENGDRVRIGFSRISSTTRYGLRLPLLLLTATPGTFDIDGDGEVQALTDALMIIRSLFGFTGTALIDRAVAVGATNTTAEAISQRLLDVAAILDIDGNGKVDALTDGLLIMRYAFGFRGSVLINNAISNDATRTTAQETENYINGFMN